MINMDYVYELSPDETLVLNFAAPHRNQLYLVIQNKLHEEWRNIFYIVNISYILTSFRRPHSRDPVHDGKCRQMTERLRTSED